MVCMDLTGKITLVTGAGGGIGGGIANVFAQAGSKVYVADLNLERATQRADEIKNKGFLAEPVALDVTKKDDIFGTVDEIVKKEGSIDNLVTAAGIIHSKPYMELTHEEFEKTLAVNLISVNDLCQAVLKYMIPKRQGKIVNIQSASSRMGAAGAAFYSSSKFGVMGLTQSIALSVAKDNINVNGICPGLINTPIMDELVKFRAKSKGLTHDEALVEYTSVIPQGRLQDPEDIGYMALYLCSDFARNITGQSFNVCGGMRLN